MGKKTAIRLTILTVIVANVVLLISQHNPQASPVATGSYLIADVPHVRQKPDFCGEACVASWLQKLGIDADQNDVFDISGLDPALGRGCYTKELAAALKHIGFQTGPIWNRIAVHRKDEQLKAVWAATLADLREDVPSIICMRTSDSSTSTEHFRLLLGYDANSDEVIYHEPAADHGSYQRMPRSKLMNLWPLKYAADQWTVIRFALRSNHQPSILKHPGYSDADFAQHIMEVRARLPSNDFHILVEYPFVVISDESLAQTTSRAENTIRWATNRLQRAYFQKDPLQILDIWLFKDKASYDINTVRLFDRKPSTPFGYYSSTDGALVMNIATGGGTLVHEIVHPFMESNFPQCPAWFNEGLGSLYEQSGSRSGQIVGLTNWRLAGLQRAIERDQLPTFGQLCATTTNQFYRADPGTHYSQARYLCYYLQEHGLLRKFYHDFVANHETDPTGYQTLQKTLGVDDMEQFQRDWQTYVMKLRFKRS